MSLAYLLCSTRPPGSSCAVRTITSRHHPFVRQARALARGRAPGSDEILLDGPHLVRDALGAGVPLARAALAPRARESSEGAALADMLARACPEVYEVSERVMEAMSPVRSPSGIVAIATAAPSPLDHVLDGPSAFVIAAVDVQDPGNLGAIVRAAEAGHATGVLCVGACADPLGWKALRGSMGSALRLPVAARLTADEALAAIRSREYRLAATTPRGGRDLYEVDLAGPLVLMVGGEGGGLDPALLAAADLLVAIPMRPPVESLNVATATAVVVFEAYRQRQVAVAGAQRGGDRS